MAFFMEANVFDSKKCRGGLGILAHTGAEVNESLDGSKKGD